MDDLHERLMAALDELHESYAEQTALRAELAEARAEQSALAAELHYTRSELDIAWTDTAQLHSDYLRIQGDYVQMQYEQIDMRHDLIEVEHLVTVRLAAQEEELRLLRGRELPPEG
ncbi:hypothetical protein [Nocardia jiangxiensis]|uniref:Uncharacterized protein n=1 Tax=Nocardia jiangxiensis TaxID=282685 RepID=A0ABW6S3P4_9NOCA|nr:hypothetical protein [Nocardia jiangxiensis]